MKYIHVLWVGLGMRPSYMYYSTSQKKRTVITVHVVVITE